ncbi:hypothetical protein [Paenisporosarcina sp. TG20]|uniref:hypothetical protein n=1 Tax=Paenisporosarcina sp. TG20 TaxID=1211706 RepID=UPI0002E2E536|nr:hypothetical protein [Paenisporosarcina sp. TG20]
MMQKRNALKYVKKTRSDYGGREIFFREKEMLVKRYVQEAYDTNDLNDIYYFLGIAHGLDLETQLDIRREKQISFIKRLEKESDLSLLNYEIRRAYGILKGLEIQLDLLNSLERKKTPSLVVCLFEDKGVLEKIKQLSIESDFFQYTFHDINLQENTGALFRSSIQEFEEIINVIDYSKYEVSINVIGYHSEELYLNFPDYHELISKLFMKREKNVASLNFFHFKNKDVVNLKKLFTKFAFTGRFPLDRRDIKNNEDDEFELNFNEYIIID